MEIGRLGIEMKRRWVRLAAVLCLIGMTAASTAGGEA